MFSRKNHLARNFARRFVMEATVIIRFRDPFWAIAPRRSAANATTCGSLPPLMQSSNSRSASRDRLRKLYATLRVQSSQPARELDPTGDADDDGDNPARPHRLGNRRLPRHRRRDRCRRWPRPAQQSPSITASAPVKADRTGQGHCRRGRARQSRFRRDVSQADAVTKMVQRVNDELGPIDILVNNAGIAIVKGIDDLREDDFDRTIAVNLKSVFLCMQAALPTMRARKWGRIVNISSGAARGAGSIGPHYNASKAGLEGLTRGYAARLVKEGITVNAVAPSLIETDMMKGQEEARWPDTARPLRQVRKKSRRP